MEVKLLQNLNHPNIVKYIDTIRTKDCLSIILESVLDLASFPDFS